MTERQTCDRAELAIQRALKQGWITFNTSTAHAAFHATLRIALNMEVEAGGPYPVAAPGERAADNCAKCGEPIPEDWERFVHPEGKQYHCGCEPRRDDTRT